MNGEYDLEYPKAIVGEIKFASLTMEDLLVFCFTVTIADQWGPGANYGLLFAVFAIILFKRFTADQAPGYFVHKTSCISKELANDAIFGPLAKLAIKASKKMWVASGSIPAHSIVRRYER